MKWKTFLICAFLFLASFLTLFPMKDLFFYRDDFSVLYKMQHNQSFLYPYQHVTTFYQPFYHLFGLNADLYYALALFLFPLSAISLYFFLKEISNLKIAILGSLLYGTGLIALEDMQYMMYALAMPVFIILFTISLILFCKYISTKNKALLVISIFLYAFILEFFSHRGHLVYSYFFFTDLIFYSFKEKKPFKKNVVGFLQRQSIYFFLFLIEYFFPRNLLLSLKTSESLIQLNPFSFVGLLVSENVKNISINITNLFLQPLEILIPNLTIIESNTKLLLGILIVILSTGAVALSWKKQKKLALIMGFSLTTLIVDNIAYLFFNPEYQISGVSRYNFFAGISFSILVASLFSILINMFKKRTAKLLLVIVITVFTLAFSISSNRILSEFNKVRSIPAEKFFTDLKRFMPTIPKESIIYIDRKSNAYLPFDVPDFYRVGRLPTEAAFASMYKISMDDLTFTENYQDIGKKILQDPKKISSVFSFYIDQHGLTSTTQELRSLINNKKTYTIPLSAWKPSLSTQTKIINCNNKYTVGIPPVFTASNLFLPSIAPIKINISLQVNPLDPFNISFPYYQSKDKIIDDKSSPDLELCEQTKDASLNNEDSFKYASEIPSYLLRRIELSHGLKVETSPHFPEDSPQNLIDNDKRTLWTANVSDWSKNKKAEITLHMPQSLDISKLTIIPANIQRLPTNFTISTLENNSWKEIKSVKNAATEEGEEYEVTFPDINTTGLKLEITQTNRNLAPQIADLNIIEKKWAEIKSKDIEVFNSNPFAYTQSLDAYQKVSSQISQLLTTTLFWEKDKDNNFQTTNYVTFPIIADGEIHTYSVTIPAGGTKLEKLRLQGFLLPGKVTIYEIKQ